MTGMQPAVKIEIMSAFSKSILQKYEKSLKTHIV